MGSALAARKMDQWTEIAPLSGKSESVHELANFQLGLLTKMQKMLATDAGGLFRRLFSSTELSLYDQI